MLVHITLLFDRCPPTRERRSGIEDGFGGQASWVPVAISASGTSTPADRSPTGQLRGRLGQLCCVVQVIRRPSWQAKSDLATGADSFGDSPSLSRPMARYSRENHVFFKADITFLTLGRDRSRWSRKRLGGLPRPRWSYRRTNSVAGRCGLEKSRHVGHAYECNDFRNG
jgi:hypothetical protein